MRSIAFAIDTAIPWSAVRDKAVKDGCHLNPIPASLDSLWRTVTRGDFTRSSVVCGVAICVVLLPDYLIILSVG